MNKVNKNSLFNLINTFAKFIFPLITFPYISRVLGATNVGKVNFANSIVSYLSIIATLGISTYAVRECSKVKDDKEKLSQISSELISINFITTVISYLVLIIILVFARSLDGYRNLIVILSLSICFVTWGAEWINTAEEDFGFITMRSLIFQVISVILMFIFVRSSDHYVRYAIISLVSTSGSNIANIIYRRKYCRTSLTLKINWKKHMKPIIFLFTLLVSQQIYVNSDITILGFYIGDEQVGIYSAAVKIYNIVNAMLASVCTVVVSQITIAFKDKNYSKASELFNHALSFIVTFGIPSIVGINMLGGEIIEILAGREFIQAVGPLHVLTIAMAFSLVGCLLGNVVLIPRGLEKVCFIQGIVAAIVNVVLNFIFIPHFGIMAAAATTAVAEGVSVLVLAGRFDKNIRIESTKELLLGPVIGSVAITGTIVIMNRIINNEYLYTVVAIIISVIVYAVSLLLLNNKFFKSFVGDLMCKVLTKLKNKTKSNNL